MSRPADASKRSLLVIMAVPIMLIALTACNSGWERAAEINGYAICDDAAPTQITLWYESGIGVTDVEPTVRETEDAVEVAITLRGSGAVPAIAEPAKLDIELDDALGEREIRNAEGTPVPLHACD